MGNYFTVFVHVEVDVLWCHK